MRRIDPPRRLLRGGDHAAADGWLTAPPGAPWEVRGARHHTDFLTKYLAVREGLKAGDFTPVAVGAGQTFIAALKQGSIQGGMTTDPTVANVLDQKLGKVLIDMRTPEGSRAALGGPYPSSSLYRNASGVDGHRETVQKPANALVRTLRCPRAEAHCPRCQRPVAHA